MKISLCIPTYKRNSELKTAIQSVLQQTNVDLMGEIIVGDNNPSNILEKDLKKIIKTKKNKISYFKNKKNIGFEKNLKKILDKAKFEIIVILTDDDSLSKNAFSKIISIYKKNESISFLVTSRKIMKNNSFIRAEALFSKNQLIEKKSSKKMAKIFKNSYILSGFCFKNDKKFLKNYNKFIWTKAPQMTIALQIINNKNVFFLNQAIVNHAIANQVFWKVGPDYLLDSKIEILKTIKKENPDLYKHSRDELLKTIPYLIYINLFKPKKIRGLFLSLIKNKTIYFSDTFTIILGTINIIKEKIDDILPS